MTRWPVFSTPYKETKTKASFTTSMLPNLKYMIRDVFSSRILLVLFSWNLKMRVTLGRFWMMYHLRFWRRNLALNLHKTKRDQSLVPCLARKKLRRVKNRFHQLRLLQITSLTLVVQLQSFHRGWFKTEWRLKSLGMLTLNQSTSHCI